jgi:AcrR family transcriptional regulator
MLKADAQIPAKADIKQRIVGAALETLKSNGFAGTSARSIANQGGFNQALIFYHFGSLHGLLLAALEQSSAARLEAYAEAVAGCSTLEDLTRVARETYAVDVASGYVTVVSEMIAGSLTHPELRAPISEFMKPWLDFAEGVVERFLGNSPFGALLPPRAVARAVVAFYMGMEQMSHLDDEDNAAPLFDAASQLATLLGPMFQPR